MKKFIIFIILILVVVGGMFLIKSRLVDKEEVETKKTFKKKEYKEYKVGDLVSFHEEDWYVLYDSSKKDDYLTLISSNILSLEEEGITTVVNGIYESSSINHYLKSDMVEELGEDNLVDKNGYKVRLFNQDDFNQLFKESDIEYDEEKDEYTLNNCPAFICLTNTYYATMIDTNNDKEMLDVYSNVEDVEDLLYEDYTLHLKYYNITSTYETFRMNSLVDNTTLFVRPVIHVYKESLE